MMNMFMIMINDIDDNDDETSLSHHHYNYYYHYHHHHHHHHHNNHHEQASDDAAKARVRANGLTLEVENQKFNEHKMKVNFRFFIVILMTDMIIDKYDISSSNNLVISIILSY